MPAHSHPDAARYPLTERRAGAQDPRTHRCEETEMERPDPEIDSDLPPDPAPASDPEPTPRYHRAPKVDHDARPETLANNMKVTGLEDAEEDADRAT